LQQYPNLQGLDLLQKELNQWNKFLIA
jgi:hypothetical protein